MPDTPRRLLEKLHERCGAVQAESLSGSGESEIGARYAFLDQLSAWDEVLDGRPEALLFETAQSEYAAAILSASQGRYRSAFKGLRLCLELYLQGVLLSVDAIALIEWLDNRRDTAWAAIVDPELGIYSHRFCRALFPALDDKRTNFGTMARTLYRELSECTHGNVPRYILFPRELKYSAETLEMFLSKCDTLRLLIHFSMSLRYLNFLKVEPDSHLAQILREELGHMTPIRSSLEGSER